jgi:RimJ/RimL family protein N-acetyltransferase
LTLALHPTTDVSLIRRTITHPRIWPHVVDDGADLKTFKPWPGFYLAVCDGEEYLGLFLLAAHGAVVVEVHTLLLPTAWGPRAAQAARLLIAWVWQHTKAERLVTAVPACNTLAHRYALRAGMTPYGKNPKGWLKDGQLDDVVLLGISRSQPCP